jgi:hypothetical protein
MSDGYISTMEIDASVPIDLLDKFTYIKSLTDKQVNINNEIQDLSQQIEQLPMLPEDLDHWISSFETNFKMKDFATVFKINKRYRVLLEERESNKSKIKMFVIDNLLDQIKDLEKKEE